MGYIVLLLLAWTFTVGHIWSHWMRLAPRSGLVLHHRLLSAVIGYVGSTLVAYGATTWLIISLLYSAPLLYFSQNDTGVILNR